MLVKKAVVGLLAAFVLAGCTGATFHKNAASSSTLPSHAPDTPSYPETMMPSDTPTIAPGTVVSLPPLIPSDTPTPSDTATSVALQLVVRTDGNGFSSITWATSLGSVQQATDVAGSVWRKTVDDGLYVLNAQGNGSGSWVQCSKQQIINGKPDGAEFDVNRSTGPYSVVQCP
jgi:hypothetical protein